MHHINIIMKPSMDLCNSGSLLIVSSIYFLCKRPNTGYLKYGKTTHPHSDRCGYSDWSTNNPTQTLGMNKRDLEDKHEASSDVSESTWIKCYKQRSLRLLFMTT